MQGNLKKMTVAGLTALTLGATVAATTSSADARGFYRGGYGYHHRGIGRGAAVGLGLAAGALAAGAVASNYYHPYYGGYGYYGAPGYGYPGYGYYGY